MFSDAVLSCSFLSAHVGIVAVNLKLDPNTVTDCNFDLDLDHDVTFVSDDGSEVSACRKRLSDSSGVFGAMFGGSFAESGMGRVPLPGAGSADVVRLLVHHLYGCRWCGVFEKVEDVGNLLDLLALSDRFLLPELNKAVAKEIVNRWDNFLHFIIFAICFYIS